MKNAMITTVLACLLNPSFAFCTNHSCTKDHSTAQGETCPVCRAEKAISEKQKLKTPAYSLPYKRYGASMSSHTFLEYVTKLGMMSTAFIMTLVPLIYYREYTPGRGGALRVRHRNAPDLLRAIG